MAAAIGAACPFEEPSGQHGCRHRGGTTDIAVISMSGIVILAPSASPATKWTKRSCNI